MVLGGHGEPPRQESSPWPIPVRRDSASGSRRCAMMTRGYARELLDGDVVAAVNFVGELEWLAEGRREKRERQSAGGVFKGEGQRRGFGSAFASMPRGQSCGHA